MRKIKLNNKLYELVNEPNRSASNLQFNVDKGLNTFEQIIEDADGNDIIEIYEDDEKVATFNGYSTLFVACYVKAEDSISIELINEDIQSQIDNIDRNVEDMGENMQSQINGVRNDVENITPIVLVKDAYIEDTSITFTDVPNGSVSVDTIDTEGNQIDYDMHREGNSITLTFEPLKYVTTITLTIR